MKLDWAANEVIKDGKRIHVTDTEADILKILLDSRQALTNDQIVYRLWGHRPDCDQPVNPVNNLKVHLTKLRKKIGFEAIDTVWGKGHRIAKHIPWDDQVTKEREMILRGEKYIVSWRKVNA